MVSLETDFSDVLRSTTDSTLEGYGAALISLSISLTNLSLVTHTTIFATVIKHQPKLSENKINAMSNVGPKRTIFNNLAVI